VIRKFQAKQKLNDNQLIRDSVAAVVGLVAMVEAFQRPEMYILKGFAEELKKEMNSAHYKKAMTKATERWRNKYKDQELDKLESELSGLQNELTVFERKPKSDTKKKERGRPRD
jgi:hypothetical protein